MMVPTLNSSTLDLLKRFNRTFPQFYEQFVSSDIQLQNLRMAYQLYKSRRAVIKIRATDDKTIIRFAHRNQSFLLSDLFGVLAAYGLSVHNLSLHGQMVSPFLVFVNLTVSRMGRPLTSKTADNISHALQEALLGNFAVEELLSVEFNLDSGLKSVETDFYLDPVFRLPAILVEASTEPGLLYRVMHALWQEDLLVINANLLVWHGRTRLLLYLLGPDEGMIPDYLGQKIAEGVRHRLMGQRS